VLYPTLGLFMSFIRDRDWQVQICRAYNRMIAEEFIKASPRLHAVVLLPILDPEESAKELRNAVTNYGCVGAMLAADGGHLRCVSSPRPSSMACPSAAQTSASRTSRAKRMNG
jgi:hypothetical protein